MSSVSFRPAFLWSALVLIGIVAGILVAQSILSQGYSIESKRASGLATAELQDGLRMDVIRFGNTGRFTLFDPGAWEFWDRLAFRLDSFALGHIPGFASSTRMVRTYGFHDLEWDISYRSGRVERVNTSGPILTVIIHLRQTGEAVWDTDHLLRNDRLLWIERYIDKVALIASDSSRFGNVPKLEMDDGRSNWVVLDGPLVIEPSNGLAIAVGPVLPGSSPEINLRISSRAGGPSRIVKLKNPAYRSPLPIFTSPDDSKTFPNVRLRWAPGESVALESGAWLMSPQILADPKHVLPGCRVFASDIWGESMSSHLEYEEEPLNHGSSQAGASIRDHRFWIWPGSSHAVVRTTLTDFGESLETELSSTDRVIFAEAAWRKGRNSVRIKLNSQAKAAGIYDFASSKETGADFCALVDSKLRGQFVAIGENEPGVAIPMEMIALDVFAAPGQTGFQHRILLSWAGKPYPDSKFRLSFVPQTFAKLKPSPQTQTETMRVEIPKPTASP